MTTKTTNARIMKPGTPIRFPEDQYRVFDAMLNAKLLMPTWQNPVSPTGRGWFTYGVDQQDGSIVAVLAHPDRPFVVTVRNPSGDVTYCEVIAERDLKGICEALMCDQPDDNVLAENGTFDPRQTITITQEA